MPGRLFTCGRPGRGTRAFGKKKDAVDMATLQAWIEGLPSADVLHLVSLLGTKRSGRSEFSVYPFRSEREPSRKPTWQEWFDAAALAQKVIVHEFPTVDAKPIPADTLASAVATIEELLMSGKTVIVVDSAGCERTGRVCKALGWHNE